MINLKQISWGLAIAFLFSACSLFNGNDDKIERTLPYAYSLENVTIQQLINEATAPDSLNLDVYVTGINVCPEEAACFRPDGISVAETPDPDSFEDQYHFAMREPRQFTKGEFYLLSVNVRTNSSGRRTFFDLLGYSLLQPDARTKDD